MVLVKIKPKRRIQVVVNKKLRRWYSVAVAPGAELRVRRDVKKRAKVENKAKLIGRIIIPRRRELEYHSKRNKDGDIIGSESKHFNRKMFSGYIIVHLHPSRDAWDLFNNLGGCIGLLPLKTTFYKKDPMARKVRKRLPTAREEEIYNDNWKPIPLTREEIALLVIRTKQGRRKAVVTAVELNYDVGAKVEILHGAMKGKYGIVKEIAHDKINPAIVTVEYEIMGIPTKGKYQCFQVRSAK